VKIPIKVLKQVPFAAAIVLLIMDYNNPAVAMFLIGLAISIWQAVKQVKREDE